MSAPGSQGGAYIGGNVLVDVSGAGWTPFWLGSAGLSALRQIRVGPGQIGGWMLTNLATVPTYLELFDATDIAKVILGTTAPVAEFPICQINGTATGGTSANWECLSGIIFQNGIVAAATTAAGGGTAVSASLLFGTLLHRAPPVTR